MKTQPTNKDAVPKLALTRVEAAEAIGVTPVTIDRLARRGLLNPSRATRRPLYPVWEIERFLRDTSKRMLLKEVKK
jgi:DNA-binding transcriptional MerR regulator